MRHAVLIMGHGDPRLAQWTISQLDDPAVRFFIHWDVRSPQPSFRATSEIVYVPPLPVYWGTDSQVRVIRRLFAAALADDEGFGYLHLISGADLPLMSLPYFLGFFEKNKGVEFVGFESPPTDCSYRVRYYYPSPKKLNIPRSVVGKVARLCWTLEPLVGINRVAPGTTVAKGHAWFSVTSALAQTTLDFDKIPFDHVYCTDEVMLQTVLANTDPSLASVAHGDENTQASRYIDWVRGGPHTFTDADVDELMARRNTDFAFCRKVDWSTSGALRDALAADG